MGTKTIGIVAINETEYLSDDIKKMVGGEYYTLYAYDPEEATRLCEITPSFHLEPFDYASKRMLTDEEDSEYRADLMGDAIYMHCRTVESLPEAFRTTVEIEWDEGDTFEDQAMEYLRGNPTHPEGVRLL